MIKIGSLVLVLVQLCLVLAQSASSKYCDSKTSICYASYTLNEGISYRVALPTNSATSDAIIEFVVPIQYKWVGMAWGGRMIGNPLTVAYPNGSGVTVSSRLAQAYAMPAAYTGATYTLLKGTSQNSTYWTLNARCLGCTRWSFSGNSFNVDNSSSTSFAFAYSTSAVANPKSNTSSFAQHDQYGYFTQDLTLGKTSQTTYNGWITANGG